MMNEKYNESTGLSLREHELFVEGIGSVVVTSNDDFAPNIADVLRAVMPNGNLTTLPRIQGNVFDVPGHNLVMRRQDYRGTFEQLQPEVRRFMGETARLRQFGLQVVRHVSVIVPKSGLYEIASNNPGILTFAQKLARSAIDNEVTNQAKNDIVQALTAYYKHDVTRPHLNDIVDFCQYSSSGLLLDLDMLFTREGTRSDCATQLRLIRQHHELELPYSMSIDKDYLPVSTLDGQANHTGNLLEVITVLETSKVKVEEAIQLFIVARDLAHGARDEFEALGEFGAMYADAVEVMNQWSMAIVLLEEEIDHLTTILERLDKIIQRLS